MDASRCPECGGKLGTAGDFGAMLLLVLGLPAWLLPVWMGLDHLRSGNTGAGVLMIALGLAVSGACVLWLCRKYRANGEGRQADGSETWPPR